MTALLLAGVAGLLMHYVYGGIRLHERGIDSTRAARVQLGSIAAAFLALQAVNFWLDRYSTLTSNSGKWTGALYTDVEAVIPTKGILPSQRCWWPFSLWSRVSSVVGSSR